MTFRDLVVQIIALINGAVTVLVGVALVIFFWGLVRFLYRSGDAGAKAKDRDMLVWGLVAFFVLVSVMGIVRVLQNTFLK